MVAVLVSHIMSVSPVTVKPDDTVEHAAKLMRSLGIGSVVVVDERERVVGLLTERDIVYRVVAEARPPDTRVSEVMTVGVVTIKPEAPISEAARLMISMGIRHLVVVDEAGRPVGVVSLRDLARAVWGSPGVPITP